MTIFRVTEEMEMLRHAAEDAGLGNGVDFYIRGIPFAGKLGVGMAGLSFDGTTYSVEHRGQGMTKEVLRTPNFDEASAKFLAEAHELSATFTPRRTHRPDPPPPSQHRPLRTQNAAVAAALGVVAGFLVAPLCVVVAALFALAGSYNPGTRERGSRWLRPKRLRVAFGVGLIVGLLGLLSVVVTLYQQHWLL